MLKTFDPELPGISPKNNIPQGSSKKEDKKEGQVTIPGFLSWSYEELKKIIYKPFEKIKYRQEKYPYIETNEAIDRMNQAFCFKWKSEIVEISVNEDDIDCIVRITALIGEEWIPKEHCGSHKREKRRDGKGFVNPLGKDKMSSVSDAIKKCATLFGIANNLKNERGRK